MAPPLYIYTLNTEMHGYWFLLFLLYAILFTPYTRLPSKQLWGKIHTPRRKLAWALSITLAVAAVVWLLVDNNVEDWVWFTFIGASLLWIPSLYIGTWAQILALSLVVLSILPMFEYVHGWLYLAVSWMLFHALVVDLFLWTGIWGASESSDKASFIPQASPVPSALEIQTPVTELRLW